MTSWRTWNLGRARVLGDASERVVHAGFSFVLQFLSFLSNSTGSLGLWTLDSLGLPLASTAEMEYACVTVVHCHQRKVFNYRVCSMRNHLPNLLGGHADCDHRWEQCRTHHARGGHAGASCALCT